MLRLMAILIASVSIAAEPGLDAVTRRATVEGVARAFREHYVFPDVGQQIAAHVLRRLAAGAYDGAETEEAFVQLVTADLRAINGDKHLKLLIDPERAMPREERREEFLAALRRANFGFERLARLKGNVGYLDLRSFEVVRYAGPTAVAAMNVLAHTDALIVDLRRNTGGHSTMIALLASYLHDTVEPVRLSDVYMRDGDWRQQWATLPFVPGERFGGTKPVFVLTSGTTFSAAEAFAYDLQQAKRATVVGERTRGGAHPGDVYRVHPRFTVWVSNSRAINPISNANWEGTGVTPDVAVPAADALCVAYRAAVDAIAGDPALKQTCPAP